MSTEGLTIFADSNILLRKLALEDPDLNPEILYKIWKGHFPDEDGENCEYCEVRLWSDSAGFVGEECPHHVVENIMGA